MAEISGVPVTSITSMRGIVAASIVSIGGVATSTIPGWPGGGSGPTLLANPYIYQADENGAYATSGSWTLSPGSTGSYIYEWFDTNDTLLSTAISPQYNTKAGIWEYFNPGYSNISLLFQDVYLRVTATDNTGTTVATSTAIRIEDTNLTTFLGNTGITGSTEIQALEYLQYQLITNNIYYKINYCPIVGGTAGSHAWSMKGNQLSYSYATSPLSSSWEHTSGGMNNRGNGIATSINAYTGINSDYGSIGFYSGTEVTENSIDVGLSELVFYPNTRNNIAIALGVKRTINGAPAAYLEQFGTDATTGTTSSFATTSSIGMFIANIEGTPGNSLIKVYANGTLLGNTFSNTWNQESAKLRIGARPGFNPINPSNKLYKFVFAGASLSSGEVTQLTNIVQEFQTMLGRQN